MRVSLAILLLSSASLPALAKDLSPIEQLGKSIFFDANLSVNGAQPCAFCHDPGMGFSSPHGHFNAEGAVVEGAVAGRFGNRKPPTAAYAGNAPVFHHTWEDGEILFVGGAFFDGRATGHKLGSVTADQAEGPFLNPLEMALPHQACVVQRVCNPADPAAYPQGMAAVWGADACNIPLPEGLAASCDDPDALVTIGDEDLLARIDGAFDQIALSLAAYEASSEVNRFSSRYDRWLRGEAELSAEEKLGLEVFQGKGLCAECHVLGAGGPDRALFTDYTYDNIGVPRNPANPYYSALPVNPAGKDWRDPGLGAILAKDALYAGQADAMTGKQKVPTLRNVDKRLTADTTKAYMHNGYFKTLAGVVHFYNTRDVLPACKGDATEAEALAQNCWPAPEVAENVNKDELGNLKLTAAEEQAIVAFLGTLSDE